MKEMISLKDRLKRYSIDSTEVKRIIKTQRAQGLGSMFLRK